MITNAAGQKLFTGSKDDGLRFVGQALAAGAAAVMAERVPPQPLPEGVAFIRVGDARRALALAAARFFPRQPQVIAAVTGTSGKTSVAAFTRQIWQNLGHESASIGTIGLVSPKRTVYGSLTTPDPIALHRQLDEIARDGVTHLAFEASSHGLDQFRLDGVRLAIGGFTTLTRDHLDYHGSMAAYMAAKLRLFSDVMMPGGIAVLNADSSEFPAFETASRQRDRHGSESGSDHQPRTAIAVSRPRPVSNTGSSACGFLIRRTRGRSGRCDGSRS